MKIGRVMAWVVASGLAVSAASARGEDSRRAGPWFGVDRETFYVVSPWDGQPINGGMDWGITSEAFRYLIGSGSFLAPVRLPDGALLTSFEVEACDSSNTERVGVNLQVLGGGLPVVLANYSSGTSATPGCFRSSVPVTGVTVDNIGRWYFVQFFNTSDDGTTATGPIRIGYKLQVSPSPAAATFGDVPTSDPAFQFIEALVGSGITAGCGGGNYCPDATLTRRQMAVFLAKALGLQWPVLVP